MQAGPREGWYADPQDPSRLRWWDGASWSGHTTEPPTETVAEPRAETQPAANREAQDLLAMPLPSSAGDSEDPARRLLPWIIGGIVLLLALGATAIVLGSSASDNTPPATTTPPLDPEASTADQQAEALVRTAQTAMETWATDHSGSYEGATPDDLIRIEPRLSGATLTLDAQADSYEVSVGSTSGNTFTITRDSAGMISLTCGEPAAGDCPANGFWG